MTATMNIVGELDQPFSEGMQIALVMAWFAMLDGGESA